MKPVASSIARSIEGLLKLKRSLLARIEPRLSDSEKAEAQKDHHARRKPIPCGMTIHTGIGCNLGCLYCYVPDMGFPLKPTPYPLSGLQLVYALLLNPYFVPGPRGTLLAFGSVTEPFMKETRERALEYLKYTYKYLGNPQQISTKSTLEDDYLEEFVKNVDPRISVLITIVTLKHAHILEPGAPPPLERLYFAEKLVEKGFNVTLFMRPIIPGITDREAKEILEEARAHGIRSVVLGSLRVTPGILRRLGASKVIDISEIKRRLPRMPRSSRDQVTIVENDIKKRVAVLAERMGFRVLPSSCSANILSHGMWCHACKWGPCGYPEEEIAVSGEEVAEAAEILGCEKPRVKLGKWRITIMCREFRKNPSVIAVWLETVTRRSVKLLAY